MEVKEAVQTAKVYLLDLFEDEDISDLGLEEVVFDELSNTWKITLGFARPWDKRNPMVTSVKIRNGIPARSYKAVCVRDYDGAVTSLTDRIIGLSN